jgi:hypothetical protein
VYRDRDYVTVYYLFCPPGGFPDAVYISRRKQIQETRPPKQQAPAMRVIARKPIRSNFRFT